MQHIPLALLCLAPWPQAAQAAVTLYGGLLCTGTGNTTTAYATFNNASTSSGAVQAVDYSAAAALLFPTQVSTSDFSQACAFTGGIAPNQFTCTGLGLTMGATCSFAGSPVTGSLTQLGPAVLACSLYSNQVNVSYSFTIGTYPCQTGMCPYTHSTYTTTAGALVNPYDLATATGALSIATGFNVYTNLTLPGGAPSFTAGALGTSASGTCVVNGTDNVACYGALLPPGYGCYTTTGGGTISLTKCQTLASGTVSTVGGCAFCPAGQIAADSTLSSCTAGTPAPSTPPSQCAGIQHRWGPAVSAVTSSNVTDVVGSATLQLTGVYAPASGALQMQGQVTTVNAFGMTFKRTWR